MRLWPVILLLVSTSATSDIETLLARARSRMQHGNREGAFGLFQVILAEDPHHEGALAA